MLPFFVFTVASVFDLSICDSLRFINVPTAETMPSSCVKIEMKNVTSISNNLIFSRSRKFLIRHLVTSFLVLCSFDSPTDRHKVRAKVNSFVYRSSNIYVLQSFENVNLMSTLDMVRLFDKY